MFTTEGENMCDKKEMMKNTCPVSHAFTSDCQMIDQRRVAARRGQQQRWNFNSYLAEKHYQSIFIKDR